MRRRSWNIAEEEENAYIYRQREILLVIIDLATVYRFSYFQVEYETCFGSKPISLTL